MFRGTLSTSMIVIDSALEKLVQAILILSPVKIILRRARVRLVYQSGRMWGFDEFLLTTIQG